jgi:hypothetical protein
MEKFNLDITTYSNDDICELLSLPKDYDMNIVKIAKDKLQKKLVKLENSDMFKIQEILLFLDNAQNKLFQNLSNNKFSGTYQDPINNVSFYGNHPIINNNNEIEGKKANTWDGRNVDEKNYPPGHLNPINVKSIKRSINIDTRFRPDYYTTKSTDFTVTLPERLNKVVSMRLSSIEIPMTFYALSESLGNTTFTITLDPTAPQYEPNIFIIKIPPGNYEDRWVDSTKAAYIESAVNSALDRVGLGSNTSFKPDPLIPCIRFTVDPVSGRSVFALDKDSNPPGKCREIVVNFNVNNEGGPDNSTPLLFRLGWQLGFRSGEYVIKSEDGTTELSGGSIISEGICFVNGPQYCYIVVNDYNNSSNNFFRAAFAESILSPNILGRINLTKGLQTNKVYKSGQDDNYTDSLNRTREYFGPVDIQRLSVQILDEYGRILDLNNMDWSFILSFVCLYD